MPTHTMQTRLHTHTQTEHEDAEHFLSGSCQIPSMSDRQPPLSARWAAHTKVHEPDTFDGTDLKKLHEFLVQCELNFHDRLQAFRSDARKVGFALSFLKGIALTWFKPDLLDAIPGADPAWANDYSEFVIELTTNFGPHDPVGDAKHQLDNLSMKDGSHINKYIVEFNRLATQVHGYGEGALRHMFYNRLPDRIKDEIACIGNRHALLGAQIWDHPPSQNQPSVLLLVQAILVWRILLLVQAILIWRILLLVQAILVWRILLLIQAILVWRILLLVQAILIWRILLLVQAILVWRILLQAV
ncbi:hypothetical protein ID866_11502 [Astraeus odoratus]|nr:hypothetical protein ID866_11502 [Astraeus odoratus]